MQIGQVFYNCTEGAFMKTTRDAVYKHQLPVQVGVRARGGGDKT